ncbi:MAG TPA: hypothetical protein VE988_01555, partial [Gemmataceae bacterium]|nr:hypothetical protein [Gemmataceae bacterium]
ATAPAAPDPLVPILLKRPKKMAERRGPPLLPPTMPPRPEPLPAPRPSWLNAPPPSVPETHGRVMTWLLNINGSFDTLTKILGPLGRWLRGDQGRFLIGWCGLAMIIVAVIWALLAFLG